jgi:hypothetical protein
VHYVRVARLGGITLTVLAALRATPAVGAAVLQAPARTSATRTPARLFEAVEPLRFTLTADFDAIAKERGDQKHNHAGVLAYVPPDGDSLALDVQLHTRGHFRLRTCEYPPLKVGFDRQQVAHTIFAHQGSLKLVVQCRGSRSYANYLLEEYLIYRVYNLLTEKSFRARLASVTYVDAKGKRAPDTRYAFFLENDDRMARRNGDTVLAQKGVSQLDAEIFQMGVLAVFQYMIGNTDWSVAGLHNIVVIQDSAAAVFPVPYDFDWSGVIWTPYAQPDSRLNIRTVRQRLFRGACRTAEELDPLFTPFRTHKDSIYALYRAQPGLEPGRVKQALDYYDDFYKTIDDRGKVKREFTNTCLKP